jgi:hypothetical protein
MSIVIIEFYDSGVRISDGETILSDSASCALIEPNNTILVGKKAELQTHLRPRESSTHFWGKLSGNSDAKHVISNAEIAYRHLEYIWYSGNFSEQDAILVTPITLDKHDLGLLLGICKKLSINVVGIVCNAALAMQHPANNCKAVYLDLLLQQFAITEIIQNEAGISLKQPSRILNYGLQHFVKNCAKIIAKKFIAETRFDPLHSASDEQQFFDKLPLWLSTLSEKDSIKCKLTADEKNFFIHISNEYLQTANRILFDDIASHLNVLFHNNDNIAIFCSYACKQVFGLQEFLTSLPGCAIIQLDEVSLAEQAMHCADEIIIGEQVHYVNALSWKNNARPVSLEFSSGKLSNLSNIPTHILISGHAYSLQQDIFIADSDDDAVPRIMLEKTNDSLCKISTNSLSVEIQVFNNQSVILNQCQVETVSAVKIGDILRVKNCEKDYPFIKVVNHEA